jgi:hypothetical protein
LAWGAFIVGAVVALAVLPERLVANSGLSAAQRQDYLADARILVLQAAGGVILLVGALFTARQLTLNREGQVTDRFKAAVDQLSSPSATTRTGGIFALHRIAIDSSRDRDAITEVLVSFVHEHRSHRLEIMDALGVDVQAAINVLGRRPGASAERYRLDMSHCNFADADFSRKNWRYADFSYSEFSFAKFIRANLEKACFAGSQVTSGSFRAASACGFRVKPITRFG